MNVAAYCRVSTDSEDQANSLENQELFFKEYIERNPEWTLVKIYTDEGITGTSVKKRDGFNEMIQTALNGGIDLILTKEVSRFARNTIDTLQYTRELSRHNVGVIFINDNINTKDNEGEMRLTIMATLAQEESRKTSSRVKWGMQRQAEKGFVFAPPMIGYDYSNGVLTVNQEEAVVVRRIFDMYVHGGMGTVAIAQTLAKEYVPLYKRIKAWSPALILRIIQNEKYVGDYETNKTVVLNYLEHISVKNPNPDKKRYFRDHHEAIIPREIWEKAQEIRQKRGANAIVNTNPLSRNNRYWCSGKVICGTCGGVFASKPKKALHGTTHAYRCRHTTAYDIGGHGCENNKYIDERILRACVQYALSKLALDADKILDMLKKALEIATAQGGSEIHIIEAEKKKLQERKRVLLNYLLDETITKEDYSITVDEINKRLTVIEKKLSEHMSEIRRRDNMESQINSVLEKARQYMNQEEPTPQLYAKTVEKIVVYTDNHVDVFLQGIEICFSVGYTRTGRGTQYKVSCFDF